MRHSRNKKLLASKLGSRQIRDQRGTRALLLTLLTGCMSAILGQTARSQTPAAPVHSVLTDTAWQGAESEPVDARRTDRTYMALASSLGAGANEALDGAIHLGDSDEGTIISISEGEDRVTGEVPAGNLITTNASQFTGSEYSQMPSSYMGGRII